MNHIKVPTKDELLSQIRAYCRQNYPQKTSSELPFSYAGRVSAEEEVLNLIDSALEFWLTSGRYTENYQRLLQNVQTFQNVFCGQTAVSDQKGEIRFMSDDSGSKADEYGDETVQTDTLDHLLHGSPVTYLKMDVEGMECAALRGAAGVIQHCRPKLAICTYHSNADMVRIPQLIRKMNPNYQLYFRHYTNALVETVCYAI